MATFAIDVGGLFHSLTLRAAILFRRDFTGTDRMGAFRALASCHMCLPSLDLDKNSYFGPPAADRIVFRQDRCAAHCRLTVRYKQERTQLAQQRARYQTV